MNGRRIENSAIEFGNVAPIAPVPFIERAPIVEAIHEPAVYQVKMCGVP